MKTIGPHDRLQDGTRVRVKMQVGTVIASREENAIPDGKIIIHTIHFTHRYDRSLRRRLLKLEPPQTREVNYSFITVVD